VVIDPDLSEAFPNADAVNNASRGYLTKRDSPTTSQAGQRDRMVAARPSFLRVSCSGGELPESLCT